MSFFRFTIAFRETSLIVWDNLCYFSDLQLNLDRHLSLFGLASFELTEFIKYVI